MNQFIDQIGDKIYRVQTYHYPEFTDFIDLHQLSLYRNTFKSLDPDIIAIESQVFLDDERKMIGFFPVSFLQYINEVDYMTLFPFRVLQICTLDGTYVGFNHRDILGSLLSQGIDRRLLGDIIFANNCAYFLCHERIAQMLIDNLLFIGGQAVTCSIAEDWNMLKTLAPKTKEIATTVSSLRLDNIIKAMINLSRTDCQQLIIKGYVRVNQQEITKRHHIVSEKDILSIRGYGKFKVYIIGNETKKGRTWITILQYI